MKTAAIVVGGYVVIGLVVRQVFFPGAPLKSALMWPLAPFGVSK